MYLYEIEIFIDSLIRIVHLFIISYTTELYHNNEIKQNLFPSN